MSRRISLQLVNSVARPSHSSVLKSWPSLLEKQRTLAGIFREPSSVCTSVFSCSILEELLLLVWIFLTCHSSQASHFSFKAFSSARLIPSSLAVCTGQQALLLSSLRSEMQVLAVYHQLSTPRLSHLLGLLHPVTCIPAPAPFVSLNFRRVWIYTNVS